MFEAGKTYRCVNKWPGSDGGALLFEEVRGFTPSEVDTITAGLDAAIEAISENEMLSRRVQELSAERWQLKLSYQAHVTSILRKNAENLDLRRTCDEMHLDNLALRDELFAYKASGARRGG